MNIQEQLSQVLETHRTGDHDTARAVCAAVLVEAPNHPDAHYVMGLIIQDTGDHAQALQAFSRAIHMAPDRSEFHDAIGVSQVARNRRQDALLSFSEAVRLDPGNRIAIMHMGVMCLSQNLPSRAITCFNGLILLGEDIASLRTLKGEALLKLRRVPEAIDVLHKALDLDPSYIPAHMHLGRALYQSERFQEAATCFQIVADTEPNNAAVRTDLGASLMALGEFAKAETVLKASIEIDFNQPDAHANLGSVYAAMGQNEAPLRSFLTALRMRPKDKSYRCKLGFMLLEQGYLPKAEHCFRIVLKQDPYCIDAIAGLASTLDKMGDQEGALALAEPMIESGADHPDLAHTYAVLCRKLGRPQQAIPVIRRLLNRSRPVGVQVLLKHALGELLDSAGDHTRAFAAHREANDACTTPFCIAEHRERVDQLIEVFDKDAIGDLAKAVNPSRIPMLIVGMPRSGTTLVEQIMASHPQILGAGELEELRMLTAALPRIIGTETPYPACVSELSTPIATSLANWYTERLVVKGGDAARVTDKMPHNFMHLGLASMLLPNTRIVHCRRSPMDIALSCYFMHFKDSFAFTTRLDWLGQFYVEYQRLMDHWHSVLEIPILDVQYEHLVSQPEVEMRRIVEFTGLNWSPDCLNFHANERHVMTASAEQVRKPIYTSSMNRSAPYAAELAPFKAVLEAAGIPISLVDERAH